MRFAVHTQRPSSLAVPEIRLPEFAAHWSLFLDVDGTLLALAEQPDAVSVDAQLLQLLKELRAALGGAVALITGRSVATIDGLFTPEKLTVAGQHGAERRDADGLLHTLTGGREALRNAATQLRRLTENDQGLLIEDKGMSVAVHFRQAPELAGAAYNAATTIARRLGPGYELQTGKMVFEIKPSSHHKGTAIESFMQEAPFRGRVPVFIGDDLTDEYGFELVNRLDGLSIKVGPGESVARWRIADTESVRTWLRGYLSFLTAR